MAKGFFSVLNVIENKQLISNQYILYTFRGYEGAQICPHRKSLPIMMAASEIVLSRNLNPKQENIIFVFILVLTFITNICPLGFDLCTFLLVLFF